MFKGSSEITNFANFSAPVSADYFPALEFFFAEVTVQTAASTSES
jgi:hypothetical protein